MKKIISAMLILLMLSGAAAANPGPPPGPGPQRGGGPSKSPAQRPMPPGQGHGHTPPRVRPGGQPGANRPERPIPPRPGVRPGQARPGIRPGHMPPPPPPPRYYHRHRRHWHDGWFIGGLGLGLIIGALANSNSSSNERDYTRRAEEVRRAARETAEQQSRHVTEIIERIGAQPALYELNEYWQAQGQTTALDTSDPVRSLKVSGFQDGLTIVYRLDRAREDATVTVTAPAYSVSESVTERYKEPLAELSPASPIRAVKAGGSPAALNEAFKRLGFMLAEEARTPQGCLIIQSVVPATAAAYAGVTKGAALLEIDGSSTAQVSVEQLCSFINRRAASDAVVQITVSENGREKTVRLQL